MYKLIWFLGMFILVIGGVKLTHLIIGKFKINRWILGFSAPFILIMPSILFDNIHPIIWNILQVIFSLTCIMFFEITRKLLEENKVKGIANYNIQNTNKS